MIILLDMDNVICDFDRGFIRKWKKIYPEKNYIPYENRKTFSVVQDYPESERECILQIFTKPDLFFSLKPIPGSIEGIHKLTELGHEVFLCSSPLLMNPHCAHEKMEWVKKYLGAKWRHRLVLSKDKTLVHGDILVDDKPEVVGAITPSWRHILYTQPYNKHIDKPRMTWENWQEILLKN